MVTTQGARIHEIPQETKRHGKPHATKRPFPTTFTTTQNSPPPDFRGNSPRFVCVQLIALCWLSCHPEQCRTHEPLVYVCPLYFFSSEANKSGSWQKGLCVRSKHPASRFEFAIHSTAHIGAIAPGCVLFCCKNERVFIEVRTGIDSCRANWRRRTSVRRNIEIEIFYRGDRTVCQTPMITVAHVFFPCTIRLCSVFGAVPWTAVGAEKGGGGGRKRRGFTGSRN